MKRYLLFASKYPAGGGWEDFISDADTTQELALLISDREFFRKKYLHRYKILSRETKDADWWEMVDANAKVVIEKSSDR